MRILIVSGFFYPTNTPRAFRTTELAKEFARCGHEVTVMIPQNNYDYSDFLAQHKGISIAYYRQKVMNVKQKFAYYTSRILAIYAAYPDTKNMKNVADALKSQNGYNLLISIAVPHYCHWGVNRAICKNPSLAKTWIADCGDPYMLSGTGDKHPFWLAGLEKSWCKRVDYITVPIKDAISGYYPEFKEKIRVIPQGFDLKAISLPEYKKNDVPTFCFSGVFIKGKRDPRKMMEYLCSIDAPFKFYAYGGNVEGHLLQYKEKLGDKLILCKPIPRDQLLPRLAEMDFLLNISNGVAVQSPSKLIDYTIAGRPIITIDTDNIKQEVLEEFFRGDYSRRDAPIDISQYDIRNVVDKFLSLCK